MAQTSVTTLEGVFAGNTKNIKTSDVKITNTSNNVVYAVKSVAVDAKDATKVTLTTYMDMKDAKEYTVEYDGTVQKFTATDGVVATVGLEKTEIVAATATKINAVTKDAQGVVLGTYAYNQASSPVTIAINVTNGYTTNDSLYLNKVGDTATVDLTYHKGTYDSTGKEDVIEVKGLTITAVAAEEVTIAGWTVKIGDNNSSFDKVTESKLAVGDTNKAAYIQITNSKNEKSTNLSDYSFSSSNVDALIVSDATKATGKIALTPVKEGTSYIIVKDAKGNVVTTLAVTVAAARKAASLDLDKTSVTLSTDISETANVEATVKDQYGEKMSVSNGDVALKTLTFNNGTTTVTNNTAFDSASENAKFILAAAGKTAGTYLVKVSVGNFSKTITVTVQTADASKPSTYMLDMSANTADAVIKADADADTTITTTVYEVKAGVKYQAVTFGAITVTLKDANGDAAKVNNATAISVVSGSTITIKVADKNTGSKLAAGSYTLQISGKTGTNVPTFTRTIVITDSQSKVAVERLKTSDSNIDNCFKFTYEDQNLADIAGTTVNYYKANGDSISGNGTHAVGYAIVTFTLPNSNNKVQQKVNIGLTVTIGQ